MLLVGGEVDGDGIDRHRSSSAHLPLGGVIDLHREGADRDDRRVVPTVVPDQALRPTDRTRVGREARLRYDLAVATPLLRPLERRECGHLVVSVGVPGEAAAGQVDRNHPHPQFTEVAGDDGDDEGDRPTARVGDSAVVSTGPQDPSFGRWADGVARGVVDLRLPVDAATGVDLGDADLTGAQADRLVGTGLDGEGIGTALGNVRGVVHAAEQIDAVAVVDSGRKRRRSGDRGDGIGAAATATNEQRQDNQYDGTAGDLRHYAFLQVVQMEQGTTRAKLSLDNRQ